MGNSKVSIVKTGPKPGFPAIREAVEKAINLIGGIEDIIKPGKKVLLNPSWVAPPTAPEKGCITQAEVTRAVADIVREMGARAIIAESAAVGGDSEKVVEASGYRQLRENGYEIIDLKKAEKAVIPPCVPAESIVTVGKCVPEGKWSKLHVKGCPPNNAYVVQAIIGKRAKAKRMYADADLD
jgi:uncharacterized protein (DUF362 family)